MAFKIKEAILGLSIAIVFILFVAFGIQAFYKSPMYENFCKASMDAPYRPYMDTLPVDSNKTACNAIYLKNRDYEKSCIDRKGMVVYDTDEKGCTFAKECSLCRKEYDDSTDVYNRNVFIISSIVGLLAALAGAMLKLTSVSSGLLGGGVLTIIYGTIAYWSELADWARFIILGITLAILIWIGYKKLK